MDQVHESQQKRKECYLKPENWFQVWWRIIICTLWSRTTQDMDTGNDFTLLCRKLNNPTPTWSMQIMNIASIHNTFPLESWWKFQCMPYYSTNSTYDIQPLLIHHDTMKCPVPWQHQQWHTKQTHVQKMCIELWHTTHLYTENVVKKDVLMTMI